MYMLKNITQSVKFLRLDYIYIYIYFNERLDYK